MNDLRVGISADAQKYISELQKAQNASKKFGNSAKGLSKDVGGLSKTQSSATNATLEFSRVVQDAPFGIRGVANNIQQLTANFGNLSKRAGGSKAALKAMLASLSGPAGILLAVSAVTAGLQIYMDRMRSATKETNALVDATKDLVGSANSELVTIKSLLGVAKDKSRSDAERQRSLNKVSELTKGYTKDLTLENLETDKATGIINRYSEALIRQSKIKGLQSRISEVYAKQYEVESKALTEQIGFVEALGTKILGAVTFQDKYATAADGVARAQKNQQKELSKTGGELDSLSEKLKALLSEDIAVEGIFSLSKVKKSASDFQGEVTTALEGLKSSLDPVVLEVRSGLELIKPEDIKRQVTVLTEGQIAIQNALLDFNNAAGEIIQNNIANTFAGIGDAIGNALASGQNIIGGVGAALLGTIGSILTQLGSMAIQIGVGLLGIKAALKTLNPAAAIGAGIALIALGKLFSAKSAKIGSSIGSGGGGSVSSGGSSGFSGSNVSSSGGSFGSGRVVFEIQGTKLVGVLSNTLGRNRALGGSLQIG